MLFFFSREISIALVTFQIVQFISTAHIPLNYVQSTDFTQL